MMAIQPISALSPGRSNCSGASRRKAGMAITRSPVNASRGPVAVLDDEDERPVALVADREFIRVARFLKEDVAAACNELRDETVGADIAIGFAPGLDGSKTVGAGRQR